MVNEQFSIDKSVHWPKQKPAILALPSSETKEEEKTEHSDDIVDYDVPSPLNENNLISSPDEESDDAWKQKSTKVIAKKKPITKGDLSQRKIQLSSSDSAREI